MKMEDIWGKEAKQMHKPMTLLWPLPLEVSTVQRRSHTSVPVTGRQILVLRVKAEIVVQNGIFHSE